MEKPPRSKGSKILNFLAKSTSFTNPSTTKFRPFNHHKGFSGPIIPLVPAEARHKEKTKTPFETEEPTSPKISCIGQIKHKAKKTNKKPPRAKNVKKHAQEKIKPSSSNSNSSNNNNIMKRIFVRKSRSRHVLDVSKSDKSIKTVRRAPSIGQMRQFRSGRDSLKDFDWRQFETKVEDQDDDMSFYYSAPLVVGGGVIAPESKKEVNLWKRRTMVPPTPLKLDDI